MGEGNLMFVWVSADSQQVRESRGIFFRNFSEVKIESHFYSHEK